MNATRCRLANTSSLSCATPSRRRLWTRSRTSRARSTTLAPSLFLALAFGCGPEVIPLGRANLSYRHVNCTGGMNQQAEKARADECIDARNVWAPEGKMVTRPGYKGVAGFVEYTGSILSGSIIEGEDVGTGFVNNVLNNLAVNDHVYIGASVTFSGFQIDLGVNFNSNASRYIAKYWNGTEWRYLAVNEINTDTGKRITPFLGDAAGAFNTFTFAPPQDWALTTVDSNSRYWIRMTILDTALDASVQEDTSVLPAPFISNPSDIRAIFAPQFPTTRRYVILARNETADALYYDNASGLMLIDNTRF